MSTFSQAFWGRFWGYIAGCLFIALCTAVGFGPDDLVRRVFAIEQTSHLFFFRMVFLILGSLSLLVWIMLAFAKKPRTRGARTKMEIILTSIAMGAGIGLLVGIGIVQFLPAVEAKSKLSKPISPTAEDIARELRGGNNFCYFSLYNTKPKRLDESFQLALVATGNVYKMNYWISPASAKSPKRKDDPKDPYWSLDTRRPLREIVHAGGAAWDRALPVGEYWIDFDAENGHWSELLKIYISNGELKQHITVTGKDGKVLHDSDH